MSTSGLAVDWIFSIISPVDIDSRADGGKSAGNCTDIVMHAEGFKYKLRVLLRLAMSRQSSHGKVLLILFYDSNA